MKIPTPAEIADILRKILGIIFIVIGLLMQFKSEFFNLDQNILTILEFVFLVLGMVMIFFKKL